MIPRGDANDFLLRLPFLFYFPRARKMSEAAAVGLDELCRCGAIFSGVLRAVWVSHVASSVWTETRVALVYPAA